MMDVPQTALLHLLLLLFVGLALSACASGGDASRTAGRDSLCHLPGWTDDRHAETLPAVLATCAVMSHAGFAGNEAQWRSFCDAAGRVPHGDDVAMRHLFERWFSAVPVAASAAPGTLTGYHEVQVQASFTRTPRYRFPIYRKPSGSGPAPTRAQVAKGALRGQELLWLDDPIDGLWLELNGSGRANLPDGRKIAVQYAGQNGYDLVFITTLMIKQGIAPAYRLTQEFVRDWARSHPAEATRLINQNPSLVYFQTLADSRDSARGALGVPLTAGRSIAVDPQYTPLGALVWVEGDVVPALGRPFRRLMVAQDTGGGIRGPDRGDVFFGLDQEQIAPRFKIAGRIHALALNAAPDANGQCPATQAAALPAPR